MSMALAEVAVALAQSVTTLSPWPPSPGVLASGATAPNAFRTGGKGIRTPGLLIANETLYQLSYTPKLFPRQSLTLKVRISSEL
jgi:hypothetical protein